MAIASTASLRASPREGFVTLVGLAGGDRWPIASMMTKISYSGYGFPPVIIQHAIWLYARLTLSFRDVEDLLAERSPAVLVLPRGYLQYLQRPAPSHLRQHATSFRASAMQSGVKSPPRLESSRADGFAASVIR
jgi:hypothetical protein